MAVAPGMVCLCEDQAEVACFENPMEREKIVSAVWGSRNERLLKRLRHERAAKHVAAHSLVGFVGGLGLALGFLPFSPLALAGGVAGSVSVGMVAGRRFSDFHLEPRAADCDIVSRGTGLRGTLQGEHQLVSPAGGHECLAYCVELRLIQNRREMLVYRDSVTSGFDAVLGTGEQVRVPPGPLHFESQAPEVVDVDNPELAAYLEDIDVNRPEGDDFDPLHYHLVREEVLFAGDKVDLTSAFHPVACGDSQQLYRESVPTFLAPEGVAQLRLVR